MGLALAAAVLLVGAAFTRQWLVNGGRSTGLQIGLRSMYLCADSGRLARTGYSGQTACVDHSNADFVTMLRDMNMYGRMPASSAFAPTGLITFVVVLLAAVGLLGGAALVGLKTKNPLPIAPTTISLLSIMIALICGCVFVATKPAGVNAGVGLSFWAFGIGAVLGIAGSQMLVKLIRMD